MFKSFKFILVLLSLMWISYFLSFFLSLQFLGILPRNISGLIGVIGSPFIHANLYHLVANTTGLLIFGLIFSFVEKKENVSLIISIVFIQGILTWLLARNGLHVGASGLIFGLYGYLLTAGLFHKKPKYILASLIVLIFYGGMLFGVLPSSPMISWEGHLFGFLAGTVNAKFRY